MSGAGERMQAKAEEMKGSANAKGDELRGSTSAKTDELKGQASSAMHQARGKVTLLRRTAALRYHASATTPRRCNHL